MGLYGGRISVFQPDACLAEMLFHDGDACAQIEALRALAERPLRIQGSVKVIHESSDNRVHEIDCSNQKFVCSYNCLKLDGHICVQGRAFMMHQNLDAHLFVPTKYKVSGAMNFYINSGS